MKCCLGSYRRGERGGALLCGSDLGPGDLVQIECACGHIERLTAAMLTTSGVAPDSKLQDLGNRMLYRECDEKGRAVISIRWAAE